LDGKYQSVLLLLSYAQAIPAAYVLVGNKPAVVSRA